MNRKKGINNFGGNIGYKILMQKSRKRKGKVLQPKKRRIWTKEIPSKVVNENNVEDFKEILRMDHETYEELLSMVKPFIEKRDTLMRDAITPNERLSATLRFLATGINFEELKFFTKIASQTLGKIVMETCKAILRVLKDYIKMPENEMEWKSIAEEYRQKCDFPNCIGAIVGKHIQIIKPTGTDLYYFSNKKKFSVVIIALVKANYDFLMVDVRANGQDSGTCGLFGNSKFYEKYIKKEIKLPYPQELPNTYEKLPYIFVGDNAFPLMENLMIPYCNEDLTDEENIYNYRLSCARQMVTNTFEILTSRFGVLLKRITLSPMKTYVIALTCCYLHNYLKKKNPEKYLNKHLDDKKTITCDSQNGFWRLEQNQLEDLEPLKNRNDSKIAIDIRNKFCIYFNGIGAEVGADEE